MTQPETILVADDDRTIRRNLVRLLEAEGFRTLAAADGDEALGLIRAENPDAVLLDLKMPGRDGLEVLGALGPALAELPVIVLTAFGGSAAAIEAMRRGAYDYLTKPFDLDEVVLTLRRALRQRAWPPRSAPSRAPAAGASPRRSRSDATTRARAGRPQRRRCARSSRRSAARRPPTSPS